jgi:hypothetical protein
MKKDTYNQARIEILNYVTQFCIQKYFGPDSRSFVNPETSFYGDIFGSQQTIPIGSLISLQSAPTTKYYLSWLRDMKPDESRFCTKFLLESIEDGSLCWWENVSLWALPKETTDKFISWRWTDRQFDFKKRWFNACYKKRDAYVTRPCFPVFNDDGSVILKLRRIFTADDIVLEKTFPSWKTMKVSEMLEFFDEQTKKI